jgi:hypothetical protein
MPPATEATLPDFVVVGAPKCGTTSLYHYLAQHPEVFLPRQKELHYFSFEELEHNSRGPGDEHVLRSACRSLDEYQGFYSDVGEARTVGEVTPSYLYYYQAAERMRDTLGEARIVVALRDPIEKAFSQYMHLVRDNREPLSFAEGLAAEEQRTRDGWAALWRYAGSSLYAPGLRRYREVFGPERVKVILSEDLRRDPGATLAELFTFLGIDPSFRPDTDQVHHRSGRPRSRLLASAISKPGPLSSIARGLLSDGLRTRVRTWLQNANTGEKGEVDPASRALLRERFRDDVREVEELLGRELGWLLP